MASRKPISLRKPPTVSKGAVTPSKRVTDRGKAVRTLLGAIQHYKSLVAAGIEKKLAGGLEDGESLPDQALMLELVGRAVERAMAALIRADQVYQWQVGDRVLVNQKCRKVAADETYPELVDVRRAIDGRFGREAGRRVHGMKGNTPRSPEGQHEKLHRLVRTLQEKRLPKPRRKGPAGEREVWLEQLEPGCRKLGDLLDQLRILAIKEERRRNDRDFEIDCFDEVYAEALAYLRGVLKLSGGDEDDLWYLLPTVQRRRLRKKARQESEARAEGRRAAG